MSHYTLYDIDPSGRVESVHSVGFPTVEDVYTFAQKKKRADHLIEVWREGRRVFTLSSSARTLGPRSPRLHWPAGG